MTESIQSFRRQRIERRGAPRAFTIIELLVVTAIIIMLISLLVVGINMATATAARSRTASLMDSMKKGLIRFKEDVGYYPPILGVQGGTCLINTPQDLRKLCPDSVPNPFGPIATFETQMQAYFSTCTLADYLIGYGPGIEDGYGYPPNENPATGIRHPGQNDGVWNAIDNPKNGSHQVGGLNRRNPPTTGKQLGPYLEIRDERLLAGVAYVQGELRTYFPGDPLPPGETWDSMPKAIVDYWGMPIRYYRRPYPAGAIGQSYRSVEIPDPLGGPTTYLQVPTLSDVYVLRPQTVKPGNESVNRFFDQPPAGAPATNISTRDLDAAEFALLSSGPDKRVVDGYTMHEQNKDNIVEIGP